MLGKGERERGRVHCARQHGWGSDVLPTSALFVLHLYPPRFTLFFADTS